MKIVFHLSEVTEAIQDEAGRLFEEQGGDLGDTDLKLVGLNVERQELLFVLGEDQGAEIIDLSPTVTDESVPTEGEIVAGPNA